MELKLNHDSSVPLHKQVEDLLRNMTQQEPWISGEKLPAEPQLAQQLGISRNTLRAGIDRLVNDGLLERRRRFGTRVIPGGAQSTRLEAWSSFSKEMAQKGIEVQTFDIVYEKKAITEVQADVFGLELGTPCWHLRRVRGYGDEAVVVMESILHPRCGLQADEDFGRPLFEIIAERSGISPEQSRESIMAINAAEPYCAWLGIAPGMALLQRKRETLGAGQKVIEIACNTYRGDKFQYAVQMKG